MLVWLHQNEMLLNQSKPWSDDWYPYKKRDIETHRKKTMWREAEIGEMLPQAAMVWIWPSKYMCVETWSPVQHCWEVGPLRSDYIIRGINIMMVGAGSLLQECLLWKQIWPLPHALLPFSLLLCQIPAPQSWIFWLLGLLVKKFPFITNYLVSDILFYSKEQSKTQAKERQGLLAATRTWRKQRDLPLEPPGRPRLCHHSFMFSL